jgi:F-type H+-transporting ATPase subunit delta
METKIQTKKKAGDTAGERLLVLTPDFIHQVVDDVLKAKELDPENEPAAPETETIQQEVNPTTEEPKTGYVSEASGHIKVFTPDFIQSIVDQIQSAEAAAPPVSETLWARKLAAKPFAAELFDTATRKRQLDMCYSILNKAAELIKDRQATALLEDGGVHFLDKVELLNERLGESDHLVMNLIYQLMTDGTLGMLADIAEEYNRLYDNLNGSIKAQITTAISLDDIEKLKVSQRLERMTGKKVVLEAEIDPAIIGGIIIRIGDKLIDGSLRRKLELMNKTMTD